MYLKELENIIVLSEEKNLTRAAERLYITPPALTQQITKLEKDLGGPLFYRSRSGWIPTQIGEIYLDAARQILQIKKNAYKRINDVTQKNTVKLNIGIPRERGNSMLRSIYPVFHQQYPTVETQVLECNPGAAKKLLAEGALDIAFLPLAEPYKSEDYEYELLVEEELLLAAPEGDPITEKARATPLSAWPEVELRELGERPFALMGKGTTLREISDALLEKTEMKRPILLETTHASTMLDMVSQGVCYAFIYENYIRLSKKSFRVLSLKEHPKWQFVIAHHKRAFLSNVEREFIKIARDYWKKRAASV